MAELIIDVGAIRRNLLLLREVVGDKICVMVKADAYGHGLGITPAIADISYMFGVARNDEALCLRGLCPNSRILVAGAYSNYFLKECILRDIALNVYERSMIFEIDSFARKLNALAHVHLKIDTGMNRLGIYPNELPYYLDFIKSSKNIRLDGVFTHFATCIEDLDYLNFQNTLFDKSTSKYNIFRHAANSAAALQGAQYRYDMTRCGIAVYGYQAGVGLKGLEPAMSLRAKIGTIKHLKCGESLGYGRNYIAKRDIIFAIVSAGYADGIPRILSNCGKVLVNEKKCDIIGNVCMDLLTVDITNVPAKVGDDAYILAVDNDAQSVASLAKTIPYEIITGISARPTRIYKY